MDDVVRKMIADRLKELGLGMAEVSRSLSRNETYMQQFLTKGSPRELRERERILLAEILKVPEATLRGPSTPLATRSYGKNSDTRESTVADASKTPYGGTLETKVSRGAEVTGSELDLPIMGQDLDPARGEMILSETAVDWAVRPPMLARVQDAYALIVHRGTMDPAIRAGAVVMFNPHLPPRVGDICLYRAERDGVTYVRGGEYRGETADTWKVHQYNPIRDFTLKKSEWQKCHRAVASYFP